MKTKIDVLNDIINKNETKINMLSINNSNIENE